MTAVGALALDAGALLALERGSPRMVALLRRAHDQGLALFVPAPVVAQAWRGGARQAMLARFLNLPTVQVMPLDELSARAVGVICGASGHADVVDVHVAVVAREHRAAVVTSDPRDLAAVDPSLRLIVV